MEGNDEHHYSKWLKAAMASCSSDSATMPSCIVVKSSTDVVDGPLQTRVVFSLSETTDSEGTDPSSSPYRLPYISKSALLNMSKLAHESPSLVKTCQKVPTGLPKADVVEKVRDRLCGNGWAKVMMWCAYTHMYILPLLTYSTTRVYPETIHRKRAPRCRGSTPSTSS